MHLDHEHPHHHDGDGGHEGGRAGRGHNRAERPAQWQTPHLPPGERAGAEAPSVQDLDLVEASFVEGFAGCSDPTSFLRLAGVPFAGRDGEGRRLTLLRVELHDVTDIGAIVPLLGGEGMRYAPLPARLASRRRQARFVYHDGAALVSLDFAAARALSAESP
ncbi:MAG TPA: hypothetical protein VMF62_15500 [Acetobacteraceae bacterium]|jgi:hypothetical protein|nr:hypothetical protein [Acetobacteraceae bacterium]